LNVTIDYLANPSSQFLLLDQGKAQMVVAGQTAGFFNAVSAGKRLEIVGGIANYGPQNKDGIWVRSALVPSGGTFGCGDFKGKTIGVGAGGVAGLVAYALATYLQSCGLTLADLHVSKEPAVPTDGLIALKTGALDGAIITAPFYSQLQTAKDAQFAVPLTSGSGGYFMSASFLQRQPQVAEAILRAMLQTQQKYLLGDYHANPATVALLSKALKRPPATITATPSLVYTSDMRFNPALIEPLQQYWLKTGGILTYSTPIPSAQVVNQQPLNAIEGNS
jgi:NitT/TauT family transport system substrate-binding protein